MRPRKQLFFVGRPDLLCFQARGQPLTGRNTRVNALPVVLGRSHGETRGGREQNTTIPSTRNSDSSTCIIIDQWDFSSGPSTHIASNQISAALITRFNMIITSEFQFTKAYLSNPFVPPILQIWKVEVYTLPIK